MLDCFELMIYFLYICAINLVFAWLPLFHYVFCFKTCFVFILNGLILILKYRKLYMIFKSKLYEKMYPKKSHYHP